MRQGKKCIGTLYILIVIIKMVMFQISKNKNRHSTPCIWKYTDLMKNIILSLSICICPALCNFHQQPLSFKQVILMYIFIQMILFRMRSWFSDLILYTAYGFHSSQLDWFLCLEQFVFFWWLSNSLVQLLACLITSA